jgi:hypothetical protein
MGVLDHRPFLPAPTDSSLDFAGDESPVEQDLETDLSKVTDATHHTVPDDGTPITVQTSLKRSKTTHQSNPAQQSQASLLIEYFENHSDPERKPSIRVRVAPSRSGNKGKARDTADVVDSAAVSRKPSHRQRIPSHRLSDESSEIYPMATSRLSRPPELEFQQGSEISALSDSPPAKFIVPGSDISSMPADSMLGVPNTAADNRRGATSDRENLKPPVIAFDRGNASSERLTQKVIEKLASRPRTTTRPTTSDRHRSAVSREVEANNSRRRTGKNIEDDSYTGTGSSLVSGSALSGEHRSHDQRSVRSGQSQSQVSINNPKLLSTVEDAIRRLILPELKEIKKDQRHASHRKKEYPSDLSESSVSREEISRRKSSGSKSRRRSSGKEHSHRVSSGSKRREKSHKDVEYDSPSEQSYQRSESISSISIDEDPKARKHRKSHRARDAAAGALVGGALTAAALKHHDSGSSLEHRERRKKRSKSRSTRTESIAEDDEIFHKHNVPPMPMRSEVDSTITRSSLLSSNTAGTATPTRREVRRVVRGSPYELQSPVSETSSKGSPERDRLGSEKAPVNIKTGLGTHHGNFSEQDLAPQREDMGSDEEDDAFSPGYGPIGHGLLTDPERAKAYERNLHHGHPIRRGLSPIQSVASYATTEPPRTSLIQPKSRDTLTSAQEHQDDASERSYSSANSIDVAKGRLRQQAPYGRSETTRNMALRSPDSPEAQYRDSMPQSDISNTQQARSTFTDDSLDAPYIDKVTAGRQVAYGFGANPEVIHTPDDVESAVASLCEPSVLESRGGQSPQLSQGGSPGRRSIGSPRMVARDVVGARGGSPLKHQMIAPHDFEPAYAAGIAPPVTFSQARTGGSERLAEPHSPDVVMQTAPANETQDANSPESEITTNPSVIQGPIAGYVAGNTSHWPYGPTPPPVETQTLPGSNRSLGTTAPELVPEPLSMSHGPGQKPDLYTTRAAELTPPGGKDEGYETGANAHSPAIDPTQQRSIPKGLPFSQELAFEDDDLDDPFTQKRDHYASGLSHGMSPLYDNANGRGADRIYDKDIRALMDHLTVRDAQRNARDTEILITLVRTAAEMRNSFEDMKKLMDDQGNNFLEETSKQHEQTQKIIGGPRPQPVSTKSARTLASEEDDLPAKRRNVFRRALMGLGNKNTQDLQNIESMLMQLLDEVEGLRALHTVGAVPHEPRSNSVHSVENGRAATDTGYEPEGQAGTSSTGDRSGVYSNNSSRQADYRGYNIRHDSRNRVSTVMEHEDEYDYDGNPDNRQSTPRATRGASEPVHTPPRIHDANNGTMSNEHTPNASNENSSGRKHKSSALSFLPKMVSRWSKTTASSADYRGSTQAKARPYSQVSQSGSNLQGYEYDPHGDDAIRSNSSIQDGHYANENRPPSPLIPSQVSDNHPKYQGFRNSINLQHPQPRQGPTGRFQNHLESEAQYYDGHDPTSPTSVTSSNWEAQAALSGMHGAEYHGGYQDGAQLSPIIDDQHSQRTAGALGKNGPPRPPKVLEEDPLVPPRPPKVVMSPPASRQTTYVDHVAAARAGSPAFDKVSFSTCDCTWHANEYSRQSLPLDNRLAKPASLRDLDLCLPQDSTARGMVGT